MRHLILPFDILVGLFLAVCLCTLPVLIVLQFEALERLNSNIKELDEAYMCVGGADA